MLTVRGLEPFLAIGLLIVGTVVFTVALALAARLVDRVWDLLAGEADDGARDRGDSTRVRRGLGAGVPRTVLAAILVTALLSALGWLAFTLGRDRGFG